MRKLRGGISRYHLHKHPHAGVVHRIGDITLIGVGQNRLHQGVGGKNREASVVGVIDHVNIFSDFCVVCFSRFSGGGTKYIVQRKEVGHGFRVSGARQRTLSETLRQFGGQLLNRVQRQKTRLSLPDRYGGVRALREVFFRTAE